VSTAIQLAGLYNVSSQLLNTGNIYRSKYFKSNNINQIQARHVVYIFNTAKVCLTEIVFWCFLHFFCIKDVAGCQQNSRVAEHFLPDFPHKKRMLFTVAEKVGNLTQTFCVLKNVHWPSFYKSITVPYLKIAWNI